MTYRKNTHDAPVRPKLKDVAPSYIPILDENKTKSGTFTASNHRPRQFRVSEFATQN
jgi:hypothetical protein